MNERIKELAEQAGFNQMGIWQIIGIHEYHERFAELVRQDEREACAKTRQESRQRSGVGVGL